MTKSRIVPASFILGLVFTIIGAMQKILHHANADVWMILSAVLTGVFIISTIYEVQTSKKATRAEKTLWSLAFVFFSGIAGIVYLLSARKKIAST
ncbi:hypothetical protein [Flaviaesturariibacter terrae]